jgi:hypothetical protein
LGVDLGADVTVGEEHMGNLPRPRPPVLVTRGGYQTSPSRQSHVSSPCRSSATANGKT